jgi:hypothetical protein
VNLTICWYSHTHIHTQMNTCTEWIRRLSWSWDVYVDSSRRRVVERKFSGYILWKNYRAPWLQWHQLTWRPNCGTVSITLQTIWKGADGGKKSEIKNKNLGEDPKYNSQQRCQSWGSAKQNGTRNGVSCSLFSVGRDFEQFVGAG